MDNRLDADYIKRAMRRNHKTIAGLSMSMNITQKRVRFVRENGVAGKEFVTDWLEALNN